MQYFGSLQSKGMPGIPIQHISTTNADTSASTSSSQALLHLRLQRLAPRTIVRQCLATNRGMYGAGDHLLGSLNSTNVAFRANEVLSDVEEHVADTQPVPCLHGSPEYEHDLAAMVHDYMENGSHELEFHESKAESSALVDSKPSEILQALISNRTPAEKELSSVITSIILSLTDEDLACQTDASRHCKGGCMYHVLAKHLHLMKYNVAVCLSKWPSIGKVPGGMHKYIDIVFDNGCRRSDQVIVDADFRSQFEIARPTQSYLAALSCLPVVFIGSTEKLSQVLQVVASAVKLSLKHNAMPLPPWRTLAYMKAKWMSPGGRSNAKTGEGLSTYERGHECMKPTEQCIQELQSLKVYMSSGVFALPT